MEVKQQAGLKHPLISLKKCIQAVEASSLGNQLPLDKRFKTRWKNPAWDNVNCIKYKFERYNWHFFIHLHFFQLKSTFSFIPTFSLKSHFHSRTRFQMGLRSRIFDIWASPTLLSHMKRPGTLNMIESSSIREWSGTNVDFDWQCRWWTQKPSAIQVRALNKTTVVQDHRKNTC